MHDKLKSDSTTSSKSSVISEVRFSIKNNADVILTTGTGTRRQWLAGLAASMGMWGFGSALGWSSPTVPQLEAGDGIKQISQNEISWIASVIMLAAMPGCFLAGYFADKIGRKLISIIAMIGYFIGFGFLAAAQNAWMLVLGRIIGGVSSGMFTVISMVFCAEISDDRLRSRLASWNVIAMCLGIIYTYIIGALVHWRVNSIISGITPFMLVVGMLILPETPRYLVTKGKLEKASKSLVFYRGAKIETDIKFELEKLVNDVQETQLSPASNQVSKETNKESVFVWSTVKPVLISLLCCAFQQLCGTTAVTFYSVSIFEDAGSDIQPNVSAIILGTTQLVCMASVGYLMTKFKRRPLYLFSQIGMCFSLAMLGAFYFLNERYPDKVQNLGWLPLTSLMGFMITYCCGAGILPMTLMVDLCPPHVKGPASSLCTGVICGLGFVIGLVFPRLLDAIQGYGAFWLFSGFCALGGIFVALFVPETKDKTMDEIQSLFKTKKRASSA